MNRVGFVVRVLARNTFDLRRVPSTRSWNRRFAHAETDEKDTNDDAVRAVNVSTSKGHSLLWFGRIFMLELHCAATKSDPSW